MNIKTSALSARKCRQIKKKQIKNPIFVQNEYWLRNIFVYFAVTPFVGVLIEIGFEWELDFDNIVTPYVGVLIEMI